MMAKPMKSLELHYPMIQFLIIINILILLLNLKIDQTVDRSKHRSLLALIFNHEINLKTSNNHRLGSAGEGYA